MQRVYICHPYRSAPEENIKKVWHIVNEIGREEVAKMRGMGNPIHYSAENFSDKDSLVCPVSPMLAFTDAMNEPEGASEAEGMAFCLCLLAGCDEIWVYSTDVTAGMRMEIEYASRNNIEVVWKV